MADQLVEHVNHGRRVPHEEIVAAGMDCARLNFSLGSHESHAAAAKLVRDAHLGLLWEGTSSVNALDIVRRAVGKDRAHEALAAALHKDIENAPIPGQFRGRVAQLVDRAVDFAEKVSKQPEAEASCRKAASGLYHATSAALMAAEGARLGEKGGDARRLLLSRLVIDHRLGNADPFSLPDHRAEDAMTAALLDDRVVTMDRAMELLGG